MNERARFRARFVQGSLSLSLSLCICTNVSFSLSNSRGGPSVGSLPGVAEVGGLTLVEIETSFYQASSSFLDSSPTLLVSRLPSPNQGVARGVGGVNNPPPPLFFPLLF